LQFST